MSRDVQMGDRCLLDAAVVSGVDLMTGQHRQSGLPHDHQEEA